MSASATAHHLNQIHVLVLSDAAVGVARDHVDKVHSIESICDASVSLMAADLESDWQALVSGGWDVVLLELPDSSPMPGDVVALCRETFPDAALIVLTASGRTGERGIADGADDYLVVPGPDLGNRVAVALRRRHQASLQTTTMAGLEADVTSLRELSQRDALTGLRSRTAFIAMVHRALSRARRSGKMLAVIYFDLDGFKPINDRYGHEFGDAVLRWFADALQENFREEDSVGRIGGDEFVLLIEDLSNPMEAFAGARKIQRILEAPINLEEHRITMGASIGIALFPKSVDAEALLRHSDIAMYAAKKKPSEGRIRFFDARLEAQLISQQGYKLRLENALNRDSCSVAYQPIYSYAQGQTVGVEALFRWPHSESAGDVIHFAEQNGLVTDLDLQILQQAVEEFCSIADLNARRWQLNVNASALSLNRRYIESLHALIRGTALRSSQICVEVTETALSDNYDEMVTAIKLLRQTGFHVALDDFGTGYSSLKYLRDLGCDFLKLDRELVNDIGRDTAARALCKSAIDMAHVLEIAVIGEGVEDSDQLHLLEEMGCDFAQGYYLARPGELSQIAFG